MDWPYASTDVPRVARMRAADRARRARMARPSFGVLHTLTARRCAPQEQ